MHILLTRDDDASFFYFLDISESDYRTLRQRQGLLVDISAFPAMLERLLEACRFEICRLLDLLNGILVEWYAGRLVDWQTCRLADWQTCRLADMYTGRHVDL